MTLVSRDQDIVKMASEGYSYAVIGETFGITKQRVGQVVQASREDVSDDAYRETDLAQLEYIESELFAKFRQPPPVLVNARGLVYEMVRVNTPDGSRLIQDESRPVPDERYTLDLVDRILRVKERKARAMGTDRLRSRDKDQSDELAEFLSWAQGKAAEAAALAAENAKLRAQLDPHPVLEAEVID